MMAVCDFVCDFDNKTKNDPYEEALDDPAKKNTKRILKKELLVLKLLTMKKPSANQLINLKIMREIVSLTVWINLTHIKQRKLK